MIVLRRSIYQAIQIILIGACFYSISVADTDKLDETVFYKGEGIELKIVRFHEVLRFSYDGPVFRVGCRSRNTHPKAWHMIQDPGWTQIVDSAGLINLGPDPSLDLLSSKAMEGYRVTDEGTMIFQGSEGSVFVTWDGCGDFKRWSANRIPDECVNPESYLSCLKRSNTEEDRGALAAGWGEKNCKSFRFLDENTPVVSSLQANKSGYASFNVTSKAFTCTDAYSVVTHDYGQSWHFQSTIEK